MGLGVLVHISMGGVSNLTKLSCWVITIFDVQDPWVSFRSPQMHVCVNNLHDFVLEDGVVPLLLPGDINVR